MIKKLFGNPLLLNPVTRWLISVGMFVREKIKNPTMKIYDNVLIRNSYFGKYVALYWDITINNCTIGDASYVGPGSKINNTTVGKFCSLAQDVRCGLGKHPAHEFVSTHPAFFSQSGQAQIVFADKSYFAESAPIIIGNDVWVGANAMIMDGVTVGDGAIIAAGAIVTRDIPAYAVAAGVPARVIRYRFTPEQIDFMEKFAWWDKDFEWLKANWRLFHKIDDFYANFVGPTGKQEENMEVHRDI